MSTKKRQPVEDFYSSAIDLMILEHVTFQQATTLLGKDLSPEQCVGHSRRQAFRDLYRAMLLAHYATKGGVESTQKAVIVGAILSDAERLREMGKMKEAADATDKAAGILGLKGAETTFNLWGDLSGTDLQRAREEIQARKATSRPN